jgi:hypothetical protein
MTDTPAATPPPGNPIKAKVGEVVMKAYLAAPPKAQTAMLNGYLKAQPVVAKVTPHQKQLLSGVLGLLAVRKLRRKG